MKTIPATAFAILFLSLAVPPPALAEGGLTSLRGDRPIGEESLQPAFTKWQHDSKPIARQFIQQPPVIPHSIEGYTINKKFNKCLTCHSWANYKKAGATKVSLTHFTNRDGVELANIAARRYFCTQCHVPQLDVDPLVPNAFQPVELLNGQR